ncbi:hypothetical protein, conserved [Eimeria tenella]|uniref:Uncharacterized protein n=1 Tax=Eimeria tenella TaxID=5802 RepID=U6KVB6_EIMTE|nr:hypothetical protein, conserved [Eimeria tenella]CDJ42072.1 hypothetical protein, conserved [Eimeria tenella]|eukprot:XP_013232822.1 hypothetical protein, conserved [Eimeria tenella]
MENGGVSFISSDSAAAAAAAAAADAEIDTIKAAANSAAAAKAAAAAGTKTDTTNTTATAAATTTAVSAFASQAVESNAATAAAPAGAAVDFHFLPASSPALPALCKSEEGASLESLGATTCCCGSSRRCSSISSSSSRCCCCYLPPPLLVSCLHTAAAAAEVRAFFSRFGPIRTLWLNSGSPRPPHLTGAPPMTGSPPGLLPEGLAGAPSGAPLGVPLKPPLGAPVGPPLKAPLEASLGGTSGAPLGATLKAPLEAPVKAALGGLLGTSFGGPLGGPLKSIKACSQLHNGSGIVWYKDIQSTQAALGGGPPVFGGLPCTLETASAFFRRGPLLLMEGGPLTAGCAWRRCSSCGSVAFEAAAAAATAARAAGAAKAATAAAAATAATAATAAAIEATGASAAHALLEWRLGEQQLRIAWGAKHFAVMLEFPFRALAGRVHLLAAAAAAPAAAAASAVETQEADGSQSSSSSSSKSSRDKNSSSNDKGCFLLLCPQHPPRVTVMEMQAASQGDNRCGGPSGGPLWEPAGGPPEDHSEVPIWNPSENPQDAKTSSGSHLNKHGKEEAAPAAAEASARAAAAAASAEAAAALLLAGDEELLPPFRCFRFGAGAPGPRGSLVVYCPLLQRLTDCPDLLLQLPAAAAAAASVEDPTGQCSAAAKCQAAGGWLEELRRQGLLATTVPQGPLQGPPGNPQKGAPRVFVTAEPPGSAAQLRLISEAVLHRNPSLLRSLPLVQEVSKHWLAQPVGERNPLCAHCPAAAAAAARAAAVAAAAAAVNPGRSSWIGQPECAAAGAGAPAAPRAANAAAAAAATPPEALQQCGKEPSTAPSAAPLQEQQQLGSGSAASVSSAGWPLWAELQQLLSKGILPAPCLFEAASYGAPSVPGGPQGPQEGPCGYLPVWSPQEHSSGLPGSCCSPLSWPPDAPLAVPVTRGPPLGAPRPLCMVLADPAEDAQKVREGLRALAVEAAVGYSPIWGVSPAQRLCEFLRNEQ